MKILFRLFLILAVTSCGKADQDNSENTLSAPATAPTANTVSADGVPVFSGNPSNFSGRYEGEITCVKNSTAAACKVELEIVQNAQEIESIIVLAEGTSYQFIHLGIQENKLVVLNPALEPASGSGKGSIGLHQLYFSYPYNRTLHLCEFAKNSFHLTSTAITGAGEMISLVGTVTRK